MMAAIATAEYLTCRNSAMMKAAAPITGARVGLKPDFAMSGMVTMPTAMTLLTAAPEIMPKSADPNTAIFAAPPRKLPIADMARSAKYAEPPVRDRTWPIRVNGTTMMMATARIAPIMPLTSRPR